MRCVIFGATGYLGVRLVPELLSAGHEVRVMARTPAKLDDVPWRQDVEVVEGDVADADTVRRALEGQQVLFYLVHSMLSNDFVEYHWVVVGRGRGLDAATSLRHRDACVLSSGDRFRGACDQPTQQRGCVE